MYSDSFIENSMDEAMEPYTDSESYKTTRAEINTAIAVFRDSLTSEAQKREFLRLLDQINEADAEFSVNAYICGFKANPMFYKQDVRK